MLKIMLIDDDPESVTDVAQLLNDHFDGLQQCTMSFEEGKQNIGSFRPDIIVLDIWKGSIKDSDPEGSTILDGIWNEQFCPVIVYSADSEEVDRVNEDVHPLLVGVTKGSGSDERVLEKVKEFEPYIRTVKAGEENIRTAFFRAMRDVAPDAFRHYQDQEERADSILRASRRRVAALMDEPLYDSRELAAWEQYLCPLVSKDLQLGDVLRIADGQSNDPTAFRLVLTPSCDLVSSNDRTPKVTEVLVAKCCSIREGLRRIGMNRDFEEALSNHPILTQGHSGAIILLPNLQGRIPAMAANLRNLELIPMGKIVPKDDAEYCIAASIDSPFRELVSWAYLQVSCRPGLPDRDVQGWKQEIIQDSGG